MTKHILTKTTDDRTPDCIGLFDRVVIDGLPYTFAQRTEAGILFNRDDATGRSLFLTHGELRTLAGSKRLRVDRDHYRPERQEARLTGRQIAMSDLDPQTAARTAWRSANVQALKDLRARETIKYTDESIMANRNLISGLVNQFLGKHPLRQHGHSQRAYDNSWQPSPRTLRGWVKAVDVGGEMALVDDIPKRGGKGSGLDADVRTILWRNAQGYLHRSAPSIKMIYERIVRDVYALNDRLQAEHEAQEDAEGSFVPRRCPCRTTVRKAIGKFDRCAVILAREGEAKLRKTLRPVASSSPGPSKSS